ncbi:MAG: alpha/beta fold hydrolase [Leptolyngbyaceae cyanobacterium MO_188.B28]|nr:alpha/beta fold hydrolase [Leptolyngbyaceae cyanobacterium MO_188.B28]
MTQLNVRLRLWKRAFSILAVLGGIYAAICLFLFLSQRQWIFQPGRHISMLPSSPRFDLPYEDVWMLAPISGEYLHGWWIPAPSSEEQFVVLPDEPVDILRAPKVMLYLYGVGRNKGDYNYLARVEGFRQLGFSVFVIDYRGYGLSQGDFPDEMQVYEDSRVAWEYLVQDRDIPPEQILIYGESMGGAIALDLALEQPQASGLILQSSFTSMAEVVKRRPLFRPFPVDWLLTQRFDSMAKVESLQIPVLFIHGTADTSVPVDMSQQLYQAAPDPKHLFLISDADHVRIYKPGGDSYLRAIQRFVESNSL